MRILEKISAALDSSEALIIIVFGSVLFAGLLGLPLYISYKLVLHDRLFGAILAFLVFAATAATVVRDVRRRRQSWLTAGIAVLWVGCVGYAAAHMLL
jgi:NhaP-type Na+/H+ or K+/H+ antiporter